MTAPEPVSRRLACIVMAGGKGTRMRSAVPKVLHEVCGRPILGWVLEAARAAGADELIVVTPAELAGLEELLGTDARRVVQAVPRGTGDAVTCGLEGLSNLDCDVLVVSGDTPLIEAATLRGLVAEHRATDSAATLLSMTVPPPSGYGRVVRRADGDVERVVEARDATEAELESDEANAGFYVFDAALLAGALERVTPDNDQGEYYLPDVLPILRAEGGRITARLAKDTSEALGVNSRLELAEAADIRRHRILRAHLLAGVGIVDPATTWIDVGVQIEPDVTILPFTTISGASTLAAGAVVGPHVVVVDAVVGEAAVVGPFCYLRPGAVLARGAKAGTYVEIKGSTIGEGSKVPHLSYIGDAEIGSDTNIGAGAITANYDGIEKHRTVVGDNVRTGSHNVFVAPVRIGNDARTGAGSAITEDVPDGALAIARSLQKNIEGYAHRET